MKMYFVEKMTEGDREKQIQALSKYFEFTDLTSADFIYCGSIGTMKSTVAVLQERSLPLVIYCWDYYLWAHEGKHPQWNWSQYSQLLKKAVIVFVPSSAQKKRLVELLDLKNIIVVPSGINTYECDDVKDDGFVLDPVRDYPDDNKGWAEKACKELSIPFIHSEHKFSVEEFRRLVTTCTFMTCAYREASTGGLTLMEGLYHGKVSIVSNSPYMGAVDYLGSLGRYFQYDSYESLKSTIKDMWETRPKADIIETRKHVISFSFDLMAHRIYKNICELLKK